MARYTTSIRTPMPPAEAFAFMADLRNLATWDPGVRRTEQVEGDGPGADAVVDVTVAGVGRDLTLRYRTVSFEPPGWVVVRARSAQLVSEDRIAVTPAGDGSIVTYDAELRLRGPLVVFDPGLGLAFRRIGGRAAAGLAAALGGSAVA
jgi:carbon monoxide dehydrogenase subunit G